MTELQSFRPAGLLLIPAAGSHISTALKRFAALEPPVVRIDRQPSGWHGHIVLVGSENGAYNTTRHLLRMGHRQLAVMTGPKHLSKASGRLKGFQRAVRRG